MVPVPVGTSILPVVPGTVGTVLVPVPGIPYPVSSTRTLPHGTGTGTYCQLIY